MGEMAVMVKRNYTDAPSPRTSEPIARQPLPVVCNARWGIRCVAVHGFGFDLLIGHEAVSDLADHRDPWA
jgi:hypothetical protein